MAVQRPQIEFTVDLQARRMQENGPYEVVIKMRVTAQQEEKTMFLLEIAYGGIFVLDKVPDEVLQPYLLDRMPAAPVSLHAPDRVGHRQRRRLAAP